MADRIKPVIKGFLTAYAMRAVINAPLKEDWFADKAEYMTSSVYELLGRYDFIFLLLWTVCAVFFYFLGKEKYKKDKAVYFMAVLFSAFLLIGECYRNGGSVLYLFGSLVNAIKSILILSGFFFFISEGLSALTAIIQKKNFLTDKSGFFSNRCFLKSFLLIFCFYLLAVLINFPGNLCYDTEGQMLQVLGEMPYSAHHPLFGTLLMGLPVKLSVVLFESYVPGIFVYMLIQITMFAASLASTIWVLGKMEFPNGKRVKDSCLWFLLLVYILGPIYSNIASTAIKDVPFISAFIVYVVCLTLLSKDRELIHSKKFVSVFVLMQIFTCLFRKNGYYVIVLTGIIWCVINIKYYGKKLFKAALFTFIIATVFAKMLDFSLAKGLNAKAGSSGEALSVPFQLTALYIDRYSDEITEEEADAIEAVLGDYINVANRYNPVLSDAVKALYKQDCGKEAIIKYIVVWTKMFFKHPSVYIDGFITHTNGWYCPSVSTSIRYETPDDDLYLPTGIFELTDKIMVFVYRFADSFSFLGLLQNAAFSFWIFIYLTYLQKKSGLRMAGIPLWISFLICLNAPGYMDHTRYAFPILMTVPFLTIYTLTSQKQENSDEKA